MSFNSQNVIPRIHKLYVGINKIYIKEINDTKLNFSVIIFKILLLSFETNLIYQ